MKKLLLATALVAGFATAHAQSSVNVYGVLDLGYVGSSYQGTSGSATNKSNQNYFGQSVESASRLGFRGSEDLGGGRSAIFTVETGLNPENSTASTFNNRQSFVGIKDNALGEATVGLQYTPIWRETVKTSAGQNNNAVGDVIYASSPQTVGNPGTAPYANTSSSSGATDAFTIRTQNTLRVATESYKGLQGSAFYSANNQNTTQTSSTTGGTTNAGGWGLNGNYSWNKLYLTAAYQSLKSVVPGTLTTPTPVAWSNSGAAGVNTQDDQKYVAATYDFGMLKGYTQWINRKLTSTINSNYFANRQAQQIGVRGYWTPTIESWASVGNGKVQAFGVSQPTANFTAFQLGTNYYLSKRTNLYAIYGQNQTSSTSSGRTGTPAISASNYAVGMRHTF